MTATPTPTPLKLGCIADDFTGATDLANNLVRAGMRVVQTIGVPDEAPAGVDAVVVALKSRTIAPADAVAQSLQALHWLQSQGCGQVYFKVCSTFDSTPAGNIGPVAEALLAELGGGFCCVTPAFPENGRTVYQGHLFVGDQLLSDSGMRNHPLTPMTDASLVRVLQAQCRGRVGLVPWTVVRQGPAAIRSHIDRLQGQGVRFGIVDALQDADLHALAAAIAEAPLVVAGSGVAIGLPANHGLSPGKGEAAALPPAQGARAVIAGSCSTATNEQVRRFAAAGLPVFGIDPLALSAGEDLAEAALGWAAARLDAGKALLIHSTAEPAAVRSVQERLGVAEAGALVERTLARIAAGLVERGVGQLVVAGGETSGACVQALGVRQLRIGPQIDPGVPWCHAVATACKGRPVHLALKSGNFGGPDFFTRAFEVLA